jgi:hypothetical protein
MEINAESLGAQMGWDSYTAEYRSQKAMEMRALGVDYDFIAKELGYADRSGAWRAVNRGMKRVTYEHAKAYQDSALVDLDMMYDKLWQRLGNGGGYRVADQLLRIIDQRSKLIGLYDKCKCSDK